MALSVLDKNLDRYPRQTIREFVGRSLGELSRVEYLLKALKNFSMFETPQMEDVHLGTFMANFMSLVEEDFSRKGIQNERHHKHCIQPSCGNHGHHDIAGGPPP
jgi:hypothetical protein